MRISGISILVSGLLLCASAATAGENKAKPIAEPTPEEMRSSHDRGLYAKEFPQAVEGAGKITVIDAPPEKAKAIIKAINAANRVKMPASKTVPAIKQPATAIKVKPQAKPGTPVRQEPSTAISQPASDMVPVSHSVLGSPEQGGPILAARLNKSGLEPRYRVGEKMEVMVTAKADCNVVVMNYDSKGTLTQVFPNDYQQNGFLKAGESVSIGGTESPFEYQVQGQGGKEKMFVYAYPTGSGNPLTVAFNPVPYSPFRATSVTLEQYRELVNQSKVFFERSVKVVPKSQFKPVSATSGPDAPNKVELSFVVEP